MANLLITTRCNRQCPYCFAQEAMADAAHRKMGFAELIHTVDHILPSGPKQIGLLGGEPTLHDNFVDFARYLIKRGLRIKTFTNGVCTEQRLKEMERLKNTWPQFRFVVNINDPSIEPPAVINRQRRFLSEMKGHYDVSINLYEINQNLNFLLDYCDRYNIRERTFRLGLTVPVIGEANAYMPLEHYRPLAERVVDLATALKAYHNKISLDCGFPLCMFTDAQIGTLFRLKANIKFHCSPVVDISPGGDTWYCFPLSQYFRIPLSETQNPLSDLRHAYTKFYDFIKQHVTSGIYEDCAQCTYRTDGMCSGGCLAYSLKLASASSRQILEDFRHHELP